MSGLVQHRGPDLLAQLVLARRPPARGCAGTARSASAPADRPGGSRRGTPCPLNSPSARGSSPVSTSASAGSSAMTIGTPRSSSRARSGSSSSAASATAATSASRQPLGSCRRRRRRAPGAASSAQVRFQAARISFSSSSSAAAHPSACQASANVGLARRQGPQALARQLRVAERQVQIRDLQRRVRIAERDLGAAAARPASAAPPRSRPLGLEPRLERERRQVLALLVGEIERARRRAGAPRPMRLGLAARSSAEPQLGRRPLGIGRRSACVEDRDRLGRRPPLAAAGARAAAAPRATSRRAPRPAAAPSATSPLSSACQAASTADRPPRFAVVVRFARHGPCPTSSSGAPASAASDSSIYHARDLGRPPRVLGAADRRRHLDHVGAEQRKRRPDPGDERPHERRARGRSPRARPSTAPRRCRSRRCRSRDRRAARPAPAGGG